MNVKELKTRIFRSYIDKSLFKLPYRKKKENFILPNSLKIHYRYIDVYNQQMNTQGQFILELPQKRWQEFWPNSFNGQDNGYSEKAYYPSSSKSLNIQDLPLDDYMIIFQNIQDQGAIPSMGYEVYHGKLSKSGYFTNYSPLRENSFNDSYPRIYLYKNDIFIGLINAESSRWISNMTCDNVTVWFGNESDTYNTPYSHNVFVSRHQDYFGYTNHARLNDYGNLEYLYNWYERIINDWRNYGNNKIPIWTPQPIERDPPSRREIYLRPVSTTYLPYDNFLKLLILYDINNSNITFRNIKCNDIGGINLNDIE